MYPETFLFVLYIIVSFTSAVFDRPPQFASSMHNVTVVAGRDARLTCIVENLQDYKVAWVHYGGTGSAVLTVGTHVLTTNRRVSVLSERDSWMLIIANATVADRGQYMCQLSTVPPQKLFGFLNIFVPPHISKPPSDVISDEGQRITLNCEATGDPKPKITWRRENGESIFINKTAVKPINGTLSLHNITKNYAGAYLCVASNGIPPAVSARAQVFVNYAPIILKEEQKIASATITDDISIKCPFKAYPKPTINWRKIDVLPKNINTVTDFSANGDDGSTFLKFQSVELGDFGEYICTVKNRMGQASATFRLSEKITTTTTTTVRSATIISTSQLPTMSANIHPSSNSFDNSQEANMILNKNVSLPHYSAPPAGENSQRKNRNQNEDTNPPNRFIQESFSDHKFQQRSTGFSYWSHISVIHWIPILMAMFMQATDNLHM